MKVLIVEDDFDSALLLQKLITQYGECRTAVNGREAVLAFHVALDAGQPYDLICLDIMMPEMDGQAALKGMRAMEEARGIASTHGAKIIMTTRSGRHRKCCLCLPGTVRRLPAKANRKSEVIGLLDELKSSR